MSNNFMPQKRGREDMKSKEKNDTLVSNDEQQVKKVRFVGETQPREDENVDPSLLTKEAKAERVTPFLGVVCFFFLYLFYFTLTGLQRGR
jgi:hypothetical protein